jgi:hypothetical protein
MIYGTRSGWDRQRAICQAVERLERSHDRNGRRMVSDFGIALGNTAKRNKEQQPCP